MFSYVKKLQYPVNIKHCDPAAANIIISQYGGTGCKKILLFKFLNRYFIYILCVISTYRGRQPAA